MRRTDPFRPAAVWTLLTGAAPWAARSALSAVVQDSAVVLMGGYASGYVNDVWTINLLCPMLSGLESEALAYVENAAPTAVTATLALTDADSANVASGAVAVSAGFESGLDALACVSAATIMATFSTSTGVCSLSGSAPLASYQTVFRSITYVSNTDDPTVISKTVSFLANDGALDSATATRTIAGTMRCV